MYPEKLIRGISDPQHIGDDWISASVFYFNKMIAGKKNNTPSERGDDWWEESINWYDDDESIELLLKQRKENGKIQFKPGAAILTRKKIDLVRKQAMLFEMYNYERKVENGNIYHGNLICHPEVPINKMKQMAASIALICVDKVIENEYGNI